ncbi:trafficking protein particle complex subunit 2-like protein [Anaeramoeba flamelloides]|uniref:Trafficking protein particle complex subunit 2-like protein n=1 Tax=Anaeramoeba flamelloides TaxID=1746091 RepID=A0AAV8A1B5_9EUKA|nr:trafficking protein particle complex subunit 2-like protein [Anaeramoeba flamelloides]KAJ6237646.1 trafficking protein particle complex subunit 2-like protein [Anaeramoeba flamelloides]
MHIVSLAVVGKKNNPLYIYCENPKKKENFEYIIHTSLDFFEENKITNNEKNSNEEKPLYVGLLFPVESYRVYGYLTLTNYKLICIIDDTTSKNEEVGFFMVDFHKFLCEAICNPFYITGSPINSQIFHKKIIQRIKK